LQSKPIISIPLTAKALGLSVPTITAALAHLQKLGIVREMTGRQRNRLFIYKKYLDILNEGTEPLER
jgi:Fic family protein